MKYTLTCSLLAYLLATGSVCAQADAQAKPEPLGIDRQTPWTTSRFVGSPEPPPQYGVERAYGELEFTNPIAVTPLPGTNRLVVMEMRGGIYSFEANGKQAEKKVQVDTMIDLTTVFSDHYRSYGIAFHPQFETNRQVFVCFVAKPEEQGSRVVRFRMAEGSPPKIDPESAETIFSWPSGGHNGGCIKFGPEGYLYLTTGDGQSPHPPDPMHVGQDLRDVRSCILRIDVDRTEGDRPYAIPSDNPFVNLPQARPEVWAYGFRNPWKIAFDPQTGDLWCGDVGWEMWELVQRVVKGGNYGWSLKEGVQPVNTEAPIGPTAPLRPAVALPHTISRSVTGGVVYGGKSTPELRGRYVYGDYVTGKLWSLYFKDGQVTEEQELADSPLAIVAFGADPQGEMLIVDYNGGLYRLIPSPATANDSFPQRLSQSGVFADIANRTPAPGVFPYEINAEPWADGAAAERVFGLPGKQPLDVYTRSNLQHGEVAGEWAFPSGSVFAKTISLPLKDASVEGSASMRPVETQVLHRDGDTWRAYTYRWNDSATDAELVPKEGMNVVLQVVDEQAARGVRKQEWRFASRTECIVCHTTRAGSIHGFNTRQLRGATDDKIDQLTKLEQHGMLLYAAAEDTPYPNPANDQASLNDRARAYLQVNCAHCHRKGGGGNAPFELRWELPLEATNTVHARPTQGVFGIHQAAVISPGEPDRSVLLYRMSKLGPGRMPHAGSTQFDAQGAALIHDWIAAMPPSEEPPSPYDESTIRGDLMLAAVESPGPLSNQAVETLLSSTTGAMRLFWAMEKDRVAQPLREKAIAAAAEHASLPVRDLFERFLPEEQRVKRLGNAIDPAAILALQGDAERGRELFFNTAGVNCQACHRLGGKGGQVGPDLSQVGKRLPPDRILESILSPSKEIDPKFVTYLVETSRGRILRGLLHERTDKQITLVDAQGKHVTVPLDEAELITQQQKSLMPDLLLKDLTAMQAADLLKYLSSQK